MSYKANEVASPHFSGSYRWTVCIWHVHFLFFLLGKRWIRTGNIQIRGTNKRHETGLHSNYALSLIFFQYPSIRIRWSDQSRDSTTQPNNLATADDLQRDLAGWEISTWLTHDGTVRANRNFKKYQLCLQNNMIYSLRFSLSSALQVNQKIVMQWSRTAEQCYRKIEDVWGWK